MMLATTSRSDRRVIDEARAIWKLGAPIALFGGRIARVWALTAWLFHLGVLALMNIVFPYPLLGVAFLPLLEPEKIIRWGMRRRARSV